MPARNLVQLVPCTRRRCLARLGSDLAAFAHFLAGRYDEALSWAEKALWEQTNYITPIRVAAAAGALAGQLVQAQKMMARSCELDPAFRVANLKDWQPLRRPEDLARLKDGLRKAGLPE